MKNDRIQDDRVTIGWREYVALPDWGIVRIKAKADSGARTSAIDVANIVDLDDGRVQFDVMFDRGAGEFVTVKADVVRRTRIKSSFGAARDRIIVHTQMVLGPVHKEIEIGLVCRKRMHCRMLIGRATLAPEFIVDSGHIYLFGRKKRGMKRRTTPKRVPSKT